MLQTSNAELTAGRVSQEPRRDEFASASGAPESRHLPGRFSDSVATGLPSGETVFNPYISVELKDDTFQKFCATLRLSLQGQTDPAHAFEPAGINAHVSIAYAQGEVSMEELRVVAQRIASEKFVIRARGFEILRGQTTGYDYLVLSIEVGACFERACQTVRSQMDTKEFHGGFRGHVSLLKVNQADTIALRRLEALAKGLSRGYSKECFSLNGDCVCVFTADRELCVQVPFAA